MQCSFRCLPYTACLHSVNRIQSTFNSPKSPPFCHPAGRLCLVSVYIYADYSQVTKVMRRSGDHREARVGVVEGEGSEERGAPDSSRLLASVETLSWSSAHRGPTPDPRELRSARHQFTLVAEKPADQVDCHQVALSSLLLLPTNESNSLLASNRHRDRFNNTQHGSHTQFELWRWIERKVVDLLRR